tara:strand:- start:4822 stop:5721 length:900 start_codon:yes stop_codon:yes gene_type:complete
MYPAFFYNSDIRNNGTARRVTDAVVQMGWLEKGFKRYTRPIPESAENHDFWLFIDDGRDEIPMEVPIHGTSACWLVDTHLGFETRFEWAKKFDFVFTAQKRGAEDMKALGLNAHWLPLACLPNVDCSYGELSDLSKEELGPYGLQKMHDVVFVGHVNMGAEGGLGNNRLEYLDRIYKEFPTSWFANNVYFVDAAIRYARGRVGFNISIKDDLNMRFFETLSYGNCLITDRAAVGWEELGFKDEVHFLAYDDLDDAVEKVRWALENPMEREKIAKAGHSLAREQHTYQDRIAQMRYLIGE